VGSHHDNPEHRCCARERSPRVRRPRVRLCLRKGCGCKYMPRCWNQRYCQDPDCQREVRRWQAAQRQARHRQDAEVKAQHAAAERVRRERAKASSQPAKREEVTTARGHAAKVFFQICWPGCYEPPANSIRNPARYCCADCRQAVRNVLDRERKWRSRNTLPGQRKRSYEYSQRAQARQQQSEQQRDASGPRPP